MPPQIMPSFSFPPSKSGPSFQAFIFVLSILPDSYYLNIKSCMIRMGIIQFCNISFSVLSLKATNEQCLPKTGCLINSGWIDGQMDG